MPEAKKVITDEDIWEEMQKRPSTPPPKRITDEDIWEEMQNRPSISSPKRITDEDISRASHSGSETKGKRRFAAIKAGFFKGATEGWGDEAQGTVEATSDVAKGAKWKDFPLLYQKYVEDARDQDKDAYRSDPAAYRGAAIGGAVATSFLPGGLLKGATFWQKLKSSGKTGAIIGAGESEGKTVGKVAKDAVHGAGYGVGSQLGFSGAGAALKQLTPARLAAVFMNTPEQVTKAYLAMSPKRRAGIKDSPLRFEVAKDFDENAKTELQKLVNEGSAESKKILDDEGITFVGSELEAVARGIRQKLEKRMMKIADDEEKVAALKWLKGIEKAFSPEKKNTGLLDQAGKPIVRLEEKVVPTSRVKESVQTYDRKVDWEQGKGSYGKVDENIIKEVRHEFDEILKKSPEYRKQMEQVAADTELLNSVKALARTPQGFANIFRRVETDQYGGGQIPRETLQAVDDRLGSNFLERGQDALIREAFDKSVTNGSMNVNKWSILFKDIPILKHFGPVVGASVDKFGRAATKKSIDYATKMNEILSKEGPKAFMSFARPFIEDAIVGKHAAILTLQILMGNNSQAKKLLEEEIEKTEEQE